MDKINWIRATVALGLVVIKTFFLVKETSLNRIFRRIVRKNSTEGGGVTKPPHVPNRFRGHSEALININQVNEHSLGHSSRLTSVGLLRDCQGFQPCKYHERLTQRRAVAQFSRFGNVQQGQDDEIVYEYELVEANSGLPPIDSSLRFYYKFSLYYNWYVLTKHILVCLLRLDSMAHLRYLDCYLLGRLIVNGRVVELAGYCACFLSFFQLSWYYLISNKTELRMPCLEFLLMTESEVVRWSRPGAGANTTLKGRQQSVDSDEGIQDSRLHSALFEYTNPFKLEGHKRNYGLRPNRNQDAWNRLARITLGIGLGFAFFFFGLVMLFGRMAMPVILTRKGFEYNYRYCINYITTQRIGAINDERYNSVTRNQYFFNLIRPERDELGGALGQVFLKVGVSKNFRLKSMLGKDFFLPLEDFVDFNLYHIVRIFIDLFESCFVYFEAIFMLSAMGWLTVVVTSDVVSYCSAVKIRLAELIESMRSASGLNLNARHEYYFDPSEHHSAGFNEPKSSFSSPSLVGAPRSHLQKKIMRNLRDDIHEVQAMIADMFTQIDTYNRYMSFQTLWLVIFWLGYSALVCSWIFIPGNASPKMEWFVIHFFATFFFLNYMYQCSRVETGSKRLHSQLVVAMALDENISTSKATWTSLLKFYTPVPMYCFTVIKSIELSVTFALKLLTWLVSALVVASSFFTVYNINT